MREFEAGVWAFREVRMFLKLCWWVLLASVRPTPTTNVRFYAAGPMRGYHKFNFQAFDAMAEELRRNGFTVINPADLDRAMGFNGDDSIEVTQWFIRKAFLRDLLAVLSCDALVVLPGWERSAGACVEVGLAIVLGLKVYNTYGQELTGEKITGTVGPA